MSRYVLHRAGQSVPVLLVVTVVVFLMVRLIPGDPAAVLLGPQASPDQVARLRARMGLDRPLWIQYAVWLSRTVRGDFGDSYINGFAIRDLIARRVPATLELALAALALAACISLPLGVTGALRNARWPDHLVTGYTSLAMAVPNFWLGILLVLLFALVWRVLPPSGYVPLTEAPLAGLKFVLMPAFTLGAYLSAVLARFMRSSMLEHLEQEYVRTAYSKGAPGYRVVWHHVLRNALLPIVTVFGMQFGGLLGGAVITEAVFNWPGLGRLLVQSILTRDYGVVQALLLLGVACYLIVNLCTDVLYGLIDPRIRSG